MPMEAASKMLNPNRILPMKVANIPNWAAAPNKIRRIDWQLKWKNRSLLLFLKNQGRINAFTNTEIKIV